MTVSVASVAKFVERQPAYRATSIGDQVLQYSGYVDVTFDDSYAAGGEPITAAALGVSTLLELSPVGKVAAYDFEWDRVNGKIKVLTKGAGKIHTGMVVDDNDAASNGTAVKVAPLGDNLNAFLNSTTANNADAAWVVDGTDGAALIVDDNDSAAGVVLYFDEDAADLAGRFLAINASLNDVLVKLTDGTYIKVKYNAAAQTPGVAVYFDDNGGTATQRMLFVSPTNADGSFQTLGELAGGTAIDAVIQRFFYRGV